MRAVSGTLVLCLAVVAILFGTTGVAVAQDGVQDRLRVLEEKIRQQDQEIQRLREAVGEQQVASDALEAELGSFLSKVEDANWWQKEGTMRVFYDEGLHFETADEAFKVQIGGQIMADWKWYDDDYDEPSYQEPSDGKSSGCEWDDRIDFRRARLFMAGSLYKNTFFKAEYDWEGKCHDFADVYLGMKNVPGFGKIKIGNQKMPFGLERLTDGRYLTFMERAMPCEAFMPVREHGITAWNHYYDGRLGWGLGLSGDSNDVGNGTTDKSLYCRVSGTPWYQDPAEGRGLLHLGASFAYRRQDMDYWQFSAMPESWGCSSIVDTGSFTAEHGEFWNFEGLAGWGPLTVQGEYFCADMDSEDYDDPNFNGWYVQASCFLTPGDEPVYKLGKNVPWRTQPKALFHDDPGTGAIELALRYSDIDLDDRDIYGGDADCFTIGLNWYMNSQTRIMLNYIMCDVDYSSPRILKGNGMSSYLDEVDVFQIRFQIDF